MTGSSWCPSFSTSTETTLSRPAPTAPGGKAKVWDPEADELAMKRPLIHAEQVEGAPPVAQSRLMPVSVPVAVKCPRYQTLP